MRIVSVETFPISLPLATPVKMAHVTIAESHNVVVKITTDDGVVGWGEGVTAMDVTGENQGRIRAGIDDLGARIIGRNALDRTGIWLDLSRSVYGNTTAIGAIDIALHDLAGRALGVPVYELIGGARRHRIPALTLLGSGSTTADLDTFEERYAEGFRWFKLKLGIGSLDDEARTMLGMAGAHDDAVICGDTNGGWGEAEAIRFLDQVSGSNVRFVEQPVMATAALRRLADRSPVSICADESARSLDVLLTLGATAIAGVSLKLIKHAGITGVMRGAALCDQVGLSINLAGKIAESSIAAAANLHCAAAVSDTAFGCSPGNQSIARDVTDAAPRFEAGTFVVPDAPGLGIDVDETLLRRLATP
jgi:muconate cycloisomerase